MAEENTTTTTTTETQPAADGAQGEPQVQTVLDAPSADLAPPAQIDGVDGDPQVQRILDAPAGEKPAEEPKDSPGEKPADGADDKPAPEAEAYKALIDGVGEETEIVVGKAFGGDEVRFGAAELKALYPALQKAGVPADKAGAVAECVAALRGAKLKADNERYVRAINARADECRTVFGEDLGRVKANAVKGLNMMDKGLREELLATPVLLNDHRFLRFLAQVGEKFAIDDGGGAGAQGRGGDGGFDPRSWVKSSNRD